MGTLLSYSIASGIIMTVLYLVYRLFMSGERQASLNRIVIGGIYIVSLTFPAVYSLTASWLSRYYGATLPAGGITAGLYPVLNGATTDAASPLWLRFVLWIYLAGIILTLLYFIVSIVMLIQMVSRREKREMGFYRLILVDDREISPFSWIRYIVMSRDDYEKSGREILIHEETHLRKLHFLDIIFAELVASVQWFNPTAWLMMDELKTIHEYEADEAVINSGTDLRSYQLLLIKKAVGARLPSSANSLNQSKIKKRIAMMYKSRPTSARRLRALALLPALAVGFLTVDSPAVASVLSETSETTLLLSDNGKVTKNSVNPETSVNQASSKKTVGAVEKVASFPGGMQKMMEFLMINVKYPKDAEKQQLQGKVVVKFIVTKNGSIKDVTIQKGVAESLDNEAIRVVKAMPKWIPAENGGKKVDSEYWLPIDFRLK